MGESWVGYKILTRSVQILGGLPTENSGDLSKFEVGGALVIILSHSWLLRVRTNKLHQNPAVTPSGAVLHPTAYSFEYLELPEGFDESYLAFNIEKLVSLAGSGQVLPKISGVPDTRGAVAAADSDNRCFSEHLADLEEL